MSLNSMDKLLEQLGYKLEGELYVLKDEQVATFLEGAPAIEYRRRLASARLDGPQAYEKETLLVKEHRQQARQRAMKEE